MQTGASGQTVFSQQPTALHPHPPMYPPGMLPYTYTTGVMADGKIYRPIINQQPVAPIEGSRDYYYHGELHFCWCLLNKLL